MMQYNINLHVEYPEVYRYWSPLSEKYAGGDCLFAALYSGWVIKPVVYREEYWHAGVRPVCIYHFELEFGDKQVTMPVINSPYVTRLIQEQVSEVLPIDQRAQVRRRETMSLDIMR